MSTIQKNQASWTSLAEQQLDPKYEKCRNITEEIYKRINITFQIKKLEKDDQSDISDNSDQIDSNELSNETDLFACDKSDISSSEVEHNAAPPPLPVINNNNNDERKATVYKRPRKRFRKRVKKRSARARSDSEGSSDEAPLARALLLLPTELKPKSPEKERYVIRKSNNLTLRELLKPDNIKVPTVIIEKIKGIDNEAVKRDTDKEKTSLLTDPVKPATDTDKKEVAIEKSGSDVSEKHKFLSAFEERKKYNKDAKATDWKCCSYCSLSFRGERGLRRHMSMSHIVSPEGNK